MAVLYRGVIWGNISRPVNGENVLGGVAYKNKYIYIYIYIYNIIWLREPVIICTPSIQIKYMYRFFLSTYVWPFCSFYRRKSQMSILTSLLSL